MFVITQLVAHLTKSRGCKFESQLSHITFVQIDHKGISVVILPVVLIQEGQLSVSGESVYTDYLLTTKED